MYTFHSSLSNNFSKTIFNSAARKRALSASMLSFAVFAVLSSASVSYADDDWSDAPQGESEVSAEDSSEWADESGDDWGDDSEASAYAPEFSAYIEGMSGLFLKSNDYTPHARESLGELRFRGEVSGSVGDVSYQLKGDLFYDDVLNKTSGQLREAMLKYTLANSIDMRLGRQALTWGTGDLLFINDMFPKDFESFFSGRHQDYLKAPSDALRFTNYNRFANIDFVVSPNFNPDVIIDGERFSYYSPQVGTTANLVHSRTPANNSKNAEYALRVFKNIDGKELTAYAYSGFWKQPNSFDAAAGVAYHSELSVLGASVRSPIAKGIGNIEAGYYDSRKDRDGTNAFIPNSQYRALVGYEQELLPKLTGGFQIYSEWTADYSALKAANPYATTQQRRDVLTMRLRYPMMQDKLTLGSFIFYSPTEQDTYTRLTAEYRYSDKLNIAGGLNVFTADSNKPYTFFGQFDDNDNVYLRVRYYF